MKPKFVLNPIIYIGGEFPSDESSDEECYTNDEAIFSKLNFKVF